MSGSTPSRIVRFGSFEFELASGELRNNGRKLSLQTQPAQVLSHLLRNPGQLVFREDLRRAIWAQDTFVDFDAALNVAVNKVRQVLNDSATAPRFIETVPKKGYRFLADVHSIDAAGPTVPTTTLRPVNMVARRIRPFALAAVLLTVALVGLWSATRVDPTPPSPRAIAVLPFRPLLEDTRDEALEVGLAEAIIVRLAELKQLRVPSINAVQRYVRMGTDPRIAGRQLGAEAVLDGSLLRVNGNVRLSARLLDVKTGTALWARQWDLPWTDIFSVQDAMAAEITRALAIELAPQEQKLVRKHPTNVAAYEAYLRARYLLLRRTVADSKRAAELLEEALRLDPDSAAAHASLAFAYISIPLLEGPSRPYVELGRRAARRALDLDDTIAEAHAVLARILVHFDWDVEGSDRAARRALELGPTDPFVLHCYSLMLADRGEFDESLKLGDRALALDPSSILANRDKAIILYLARRYEESVDQSRRTLELDPHYAPAYFYLGRAYEQLNRPDDALEAYLTPLTFSERNRDTVAALRAAARRGGPKEFWKLRLRYFLEQPEVPIASVASAYVRIGDHDRAMEWLEKLYADRGAWIRGLKVQPLWDPLRNDPRFQDLLRRANLIPVSLTAASPQPTAR